MRQQYTRRNMFKFIFGVGAWSAAAAHSYTRPIAVVETNLARKDVTITTLSERDTLVVAEHVMKMMLAQR